MALIFRMADSYTLDECGMAFLLSLPATSAFKEYTENLPQLSIFEVLMWLWQRAFGIKEFTTRIPSMLFFLGSLVVIYRLGKINASRNAAILACLIATAIPQIQEFSTTARPYSMAIFFCSLCLFFLNRWDQTKSRNDILKCGFWLTAAILTKVFCITLMAFIVPFVYLRSAKKQKLHIIREIVVFSWLPTLATVLLLPMTLHFKHQSHIHSFAGHPTFKLFYDLILVRLFPVDISLIIGTLFAAKLTHERFKKIKPPSRQTIATIIMAAIPPALLGVATVATGTFLLSEKYVVAAYVPAILFLGILAKEASRLQYAYVVLAAYLVFSGLLSSLTIPFGREDWRRAISIANNMELIRSPNLLLSSGFFENQHPEMIDAAFVQAPAKIYKPSGKIINVPDYYSHDSMISW